MLSKLRTHLAKFGSSLASMTFGFFDSFTGSDNPLMPPEPGLPFADDYMNISNRTDFEGFLIQLVNFALWFLGFAFLAVLVYGGVIYLTAGDKDEQSQKARKIIVMSIVGLIVIFISYAVVYSLINEFYSLGLLPD